MWKDISIPIRCTTFKSYMAVKLRVEAITRHCLTGRHFIVTGLFHKKTVSQWTVIYLDHMIHSLGYDWEYNSIWPLLDILDITRYVRDINIHW